MTQQPPPFKKTEADGIEILCVKDVAEYLKKSPSWVYKNFKLLGGAKIGGSVFFPPKEKIYERLFQQTEEMVGVLFPVQKAPLHGGRIQNQERSGGRRSRTEKGGETAAEAEARKNRHGLFDPA